MKLDLKELLAKITGQAEFKTLLWTGSSDSTQAPTTFLVNDYFDAIDVYFRGNGRPMVPMRVERSMGSRTCNITWANYFAYRVIGFDGSQVTIGVGGYYNAYNAGSAINGDSYAVPYKIYGVKYVWGGVLRSISKAFSHFHKGGGVNESQHKGTYAKTTPEHSRSERLHGHVQCGGKFTNRFRLVVRPSAFGLESVDNDARCTERSEHKCIRELSGLAYLRGTSVCKDIYDTIKCVTSVLLPLHTALTISERGWAV